MGDRDWRTTRERHDTLVRSQLARYRGREVKTMGDGFLITFDGPARAVRCAQAIVSGVADLGIEVRAGCTPVRSNSTVTTWLALPLR